MKEKRSKKRKKPSVRRNHQRSYLNKENDKLKMKGEMRIGVVKRLGGMRTQAPLDLVDMIIRGVSADMIIRGMSISPFMEWIEEEFKPIDSTPPTFDKFNGKIDPIFHQM